MVLKSFLVLAKTVAQKKLQELEKKTGYSKVYFFLLFCSLFCCFLYFLGGPKSVTDLVSFVYPAYMSFKAIDSADPTDDTQWLTYWVVFAFVSIIENGFVFISDIIPAYFALKVSFFIWLYHPKFMGAGVVYTQGIKPFVLPYLSNFSSKSVQKKQE